MIAMGRTYVKHESHGITGYLMWHVLCTKQTIIHKGKNNKGWNGFNGYKICKMGYNPFMIWCNELVSWRLLWYQSNQKLDIIGIHRDLQIKLFHFDGNF